MTLEVVCSVNTLFLCVGPLEASHKYFLVSYSLLPISNPNRSVFMTTNGDTDRHTTEISILPQCQGLHSFISSRFPIYTMSSTTAKSPQGDPKHGGALFRLPREIRDVIYRRLVKGRYLTDKRSAHSEGSDKEGSDSESDVDQNAGPNLSILRVSKAVGHEAVEILYSDSVFRFPIDFKSPRDDDEDGKLFHLNHLKKVAPMMKNVYLDVDGASIRWAGWFETRYSPMWARKLELSSGPTIDLFGDVDIKRRTLHIGMSECCARMLEGTSFGTICQRLKSLVGFSVATVEVMLSRDVPQAPASFGFNNAEQTRRARDLMRYITHKITKELEPAFGPAISGLQLDAGNMPIQKRNFSEGGDTTLVGFLEFHPGKHSVQECTAEEERLQ